MTNGQEERIDLLLMASSLQKQVFYRLLAAFIASGLVVIVATVWFQSRALERTILSRQQDIADHFQGRMTDLHREWEAEAAQLKQNLEFTRVLEFRRPELLKAFFLTQSNSDFNHAIITDPRGALLLQYGVDDEMRKAVSRIVKQEPWFYHRTQKTLYHVSATPVWLGNTETGFLFLLKPMDNALLGHIAYPHTDLCLLLDGQPVASSLGGKGVEQFAGVEGKASVKGTRYTQVSIPWKDPHQRSDVSPTLIIRTQIRDSLSGFEIVLIVLAALVVLAATSRFVLGAWIGGIISDIVTLKTNSDYFARERKLPLTAGFPGSGEHEERGDELGALRTGLVSMMQTVIESEQRFRNVEEVLRKEHDFAESLVDNAPVIILLLDTRGIIQHVNPYFEQLTGYRLDEIRGKEWFTTFLPTQDQERIRALFRTAAYDVPVRGNINPIVTRNGEEREIEWNAQAMRDAHGNVTAVLSIGLDITERKRAEEKLSEQERQQKAILNSIPDIAWLKDRESRFIAVNEAFGRAAGVDYRALTGKTDYDVWPADLAERYRADDRAVMETGVRKNIEEPLIDSNGKEIWIETIKTPIYNESGEIIGTAGIARDFTERKRAEEQLRQSEERLRHAQQVAHIGSWQLDITQNRLEWSDEIFRIFEIDQEGFGASYEAFLNAIHPDDREMVNAAYKDSVLNSKPYNIVHRLLMPDGRIKYVHEICETIYDDQGRSLRSIGTIQDITERKSLENEREQHLKELTHLMKTVTHSQKEWQVTFDSITDLITIHDANHTIVKANKAFAQCYNTTPQAVVGRKCHEFFHGTNTPIQGCPLEGALCGNEPGTHEFTDDRSGRTYSITVFPMTFPGSENRGIIHIARDITSEREKEMRLIMSERLASLGQMAAGIAHEINNPLAAIAGCAEGLLNRVQKKSFDPELFENYLKIIEEEILRCKNITTGMLSFVRKTTYDTQDLDIPKILDKTIEIIGFQGRLKEVELIKEYKEGMPHIKGSEGELRQVFLAVITNALDVMEDRGKLTLETGFEGKKIFVRITDTGSGISLEHVSRIFDPFFTTKLEKGGTGLGLAIAKKIVSSHNGSIDVVSEEGKGTTFIVTLPL